MEIKEYKPNSHKSKLEAKQAEEKREKIAAVAKAKVVKKKKNNFLSSFISDDAVSIKDYIVDEFLIPLVQNTICDIFEEIPKTIFYGKSGRRRSSNANRVSYTKYSSRRDRDRDYRDRDRDRDRDRYDRRTNIFDSTDIVFDSRGEAEKVLAVMDEIMQEYEIVRVADLYDLAGVSCDFPANDYGWTNIRNARVVHVRDGWVIEMPRAVSI